MVKRGTYLVAALTLPLLFSGVVTADATKADCSIYNTGTDSYNACIANNNNESYVTCTNNVYTVFTGSQTANSGNTTSGSAVNASGSTVTIGTSCGTPATTQTPGTGSGTPTPTPTTTQTQTTANTTPKSTVKPAATVLPDTGSNAVTEGAAIGLLAVAGMFTLSKLGLALARRVSLR